MSESLRIGGHGLFEADAEPSDLLMSPWPIHGHHIPTRRTGVFYSRSLLEEGRANKSMRPRLGLEALRGDRKGQHSIRINSQWRVCFRWTDDGPREVEIVDYHLRSLT